MSLHLYVMPLWRFKVGDFTTPIESSLGIRPKILTGEGVFDAPTPTKVSLRARWRARREVAAVRRAVTRANNVPIDWQDEGNMVLGDSANGMEPLRAFARWVDHRDQLPTFDPPPDNNYDNHPVWTIESDRPASSPHLVEHSCFNGYYLPCDFDRVVKVEPYLVFGRWPAYHSVGSTVRLRRELDRLADQLPGSDPGPGPTDDPFAPVWWAFQQLSEAADLSLKHALPIIFWG